MSINKISLFAAMLSWPSIVQANEISDAMASLDPGSINLCVMQAEVVSTATEMRLTGRSRPETIRKVMTMDLGLSNSVEGGKVLLTGAITRVNEVFDIDLGDLTIPFPEEEVEPRSRLMGEIAFNNCIELISNAASTGEEGR